jgi:hypothetical protein
MNAGAADPSSLQPWRSHGSEADGSSSGIKHTTSAASTRHAACSPLGLFQPSKTLHPGHPSYSMGQAVYSGATKPHARLGPVFAQGSADSSSFGDTLVTCGGTGGLSTLKIALSIGPAATSIFLSVGTSMLVFPFFTYVRSTGLLADRLPQVCVCVWGEGGGC